MGAFTIGSSGICTKQGQREEKIDLKTGRKEKWENDAGGGRLRRVKKEEKYRVGGWVQVETRTRTSLEKILTPKTAENYKMEKSQV